MPDALLEIGTEEIPAAELPEAMRQLRDLTRRELSRCRLTGSVTVYGTPRRLAVRVDGLPPRQPDVSEEVMGPPARVAYDADGHPTKAAEGFARKLGVSVDELKVKETERGAYVYAHRHEPGRALGELLPEVFANVCSGLRFRRAMRWGPRGVSFVRPVRWLVALVDDRVVDLEAFGLKAGRRTRGHRFMAPGPIDIPSPASYVDLLRDSYVLADPDERRNSLREELARVGRDVAERGWRVRADEGLEEEILGLVEWPVAVVGRFEEDFLELPEEVLVTSMRNHQRFFALEDERGNLAPGFVGVLGTRVRDLSVAAEGMERVLRARLADARFFWQEDLKVPLEDFAEQLRDALFHRRIGSMYDKSMRTARLAGELASLFGADRASVETAGRLCKADLMSQMVGEFPELQGVMGREYARRQGLGEDVAVAIWEHYRPQGAADELPSTAAGAALAVADRLDTIVAGFGAGLKPSGSGDPFALRRAALGLLRILLDRQVSVSLTDLVERARALLPEDLRVPAGEVVAFLLERLRVLLADRYSGQVVRAVLQAGGDDPVDLARRCEAVASLQGQPVFQTLGKAFRRTVNIFKQAEGRLGGSVDPERFQQDEERRLWGQLQEVGQSAEVRLSQGDYRAALEEMARLAPAIDAFFDAVRVLDTDREELTRNRLALLQEVDRLFRRVADFKIMARQ